MIYMKSSGIYIENKKNYLCIIHNLQSDILIYFYLKQKEPPLELPFAYHEKKMA